MSTPSIRMGWHMGISSGVRFAPITPAICATVSTSPFFIPPVWMSRKVSAFTSTLAAATAVRRVGAFSPTSTILALPWVLKWVKSSACSIIKSVNSSIWSNPNRGTGHAPSPSVTTAA